MADPVATGRKRSGTAAALLAGTVSLLALPSAVLAFSSRFDMQPIVDDSADADGFRPVAVDPRLARSVTVRALSQGRTFRFTPAATPTRMDRSLTVAVRLDPGAGRQLAVRGPAGGANSAGQGLGIASTAYSLGAARGYKGFAQGSAGPDIRKIDMPDLATFRPSPGARSDPARFSPRIVLDEHERAGRSPRTFEGDADQTVDLGGSYRVGRNLNVTAGVRYSSERDRLVPLTDGKQGTQAVYVGTQFKF